MTTKKTKPAKEKPVVVVPPEVVESEQIAKPAELPPGVKADPTLKEKVEKKKAAYAAFKKLYPELYERRGLDKKLKITLAKLR